MSNFPTSLDDDISLPPVSNNITEIGEELFNALREVAFATEAEIGIGASGTVGSVAARLAVCFNPDGTLKPSAITSLSDGLTTVGGWVTNFHINAVAQITESKLDLDHSTTSLYNTLVTQQSEIDSALAFIQAAGSKVNPHLAGITYRHVLDHIDISLDSSDFFRDRNNVLRDNTDLYTLLNNINTDLVSHQKSDGTDTGTIPPDNYGHVAAGVFVNTSNFSFIPQTATDLQQFAQFIDNSNIFILGTRIQTFYSNGIARTARSGGLLNSENGQPIVPETPVTTYLLDGYASTPVDNIDTGDDLVEFFPDVTSLSNNSFESKFSAVKIGDILTVNYGNFSVPNVIIEKKSISVDSNKRFLVRINRKNVMDGYGFTARIDKPLFNTNKYGVLALAQANTPFNATSSLIVGNPRGAQILGIDFNPDQIDLAHYNLWLAFYPSGNPATSRVTLFKIDITGNRGTTPGKYTLESIVESTNNSFRAAGFNYRFIAFSYKGNFGIMLADPYGNAGFSIISGIVATTGLYDNGLSRAVYSNNVLGTPGFDNYDALGIGPGKGDIASPAFSATYANSALAQIPTKLFLPLSRNNYYVNGVERERFALEAGQILDGYGDGYWTATITNKLIVPGVRQEVTYRVDEDLSNARLRNGKTLVIQSSTGYVDSGRFFIKDVQFNNCPGDDAFTNIVVYDSIHGIGSSPYLSAPVGTIVGLYFNGDSLGFSTENASDFTTISTPFKRHFEAYINQDGYTFTHERGRLSINSTNITVNGITVYTDTNLTGLNIYKISPKLRGYAFSSIVKVNLAITAFNQTTGIYSGYLRKWDGSTETHIGPVTTGKKGDIVRFYDETNIDYVDVIFSLDESVPTISSTKHIDIQIFPTLSLDDEVMLLGTCQLNGTTNKIQYLRDERQFGNISETQLSNSALDYISAPTQLINENGIIRGFGILDTDLSGDGYNVFYIEGGIAVVNGKIVKVNDEILTIPIIQETLYPAFSVDITTTKWFLCINDNGKFEFMASTDFDPDGYFVAYYATAGLDHTRLMYVKNPNDSTGTQYAIRGTYFSDLITNHRNLIPVAVITAPVVLSGINYIIDEDSTVFEDARRFISNGYSGLAAPFTFGTNASFRTFEALNTWLKELNKYKAGTVNIINKYGDTVLVKDSMDISGEIFSFGKKVKFVGDGGRFVVTSSTFMTNVHLENLRLDIEIGNGITFSGVQNNLTQCYVSHSTTASVYPFVIATGSSVRFTDNVFTSSVSITAFINATASAKTQILVGNIYKTGSVLIATGTFLPSTITTLNAADGA